MAEKKYLFSKYAYPERWQSYRQQIAEILKLTPDSVLVIGPGDNIVVDILKKYIKEVKTLDVDGRLNPDFTASVENMPIADSSFGAVLCAEVLEHLSFDKFGKCLLEIKRVTRKNIVLSLPHFGPPVKFFLKLPFLKEIKIFFKIPFPLKHKSGDVHHWEIGKKGYPPSKIKNEIESAGLNIIDDFVLPESPYHHFFVIENIKAKINAS